MMSISFFHPLVLYPYFIWTFKRPFTVVTTNSPLAYQLSDSSFLLQSQKKKKKKNMELLKLSTLTETLYTFFIYFKLNFLVKSKVVR